MQSAFVKHVQSRLVESPVAFPNTHALLGEDGGLSKPCRDFLAWNRCLFSAKLAKPALQKYVQNQMCKLPLLGYVNP